MKKPKQDKKHRKLKPKRSKKSARKKLCISGKIHRVAIDSITPDPRNARTHSKKQIGQIANSMELFGFTNPIIVDENGMTIAGHGRLLAAKRHCQTKYYCF